MSIRTTLCLVLLAAGMPALLPAPTAAQTTFTFCYVPKAGVVYRIGTPDTSAGCLNHRHVEFSFTEGVADGSVGTIQLADGAVTTAKIQDAAVTPPKLGFDPATQDELDALLAALGADGTVNDPGNPVEWSQLRGVPDGFADGTDDAGGGANDLECTACVDEGEIADGAVTSAAIASGAVHGGLGGPIADRSISGVDIAEGGVELSNIAAGAVRENHIFPGAVSTQHLASGAITSQKLADGAVTAAKIGDGTITGAHVQNGSLTTRDVGVASGTFTVDFPLFDPGRCHTVSKSPPGLDANDVVVVTRGRELHSSAATMAVQRDGPDSYEIRFCSTAPGFWDPGPISFSYVVFEVP